MHINPQALDATKSHHMLRNLVMPRPIALVSTINLQGLVKCGYTEYQGISSQCDNVVMVHVKAELWHNGQPDCLGMNVMGRLGDDYYQGVREPFIMERMKYDE